MHKLWAPVVAAVFLAGCGGGSDDTSSAELSYDDSPLYQAIGLDASDEDALQAQFDEQQKLANELTTTCMRDAGFEYVPQDFGAQASFEDPYAEAYLLPAEEFAAQYGWGMTTMYGPDQQDSFGPTEEYVDPNQEYLDSLSEAEVQAFYDTLYGASPEFDPGVDGEDLMQEYVPSGCEGLAFEEAYNSEDSQFAVFDKYADELQTMYEQIQADPRIVEFERKWAGCMSEKGFAYDSVQDANEYFGEQMNKVWETMTFPGDELKPEQFEAMTEDELNAYYSQPQEFDQELLDEIRAEEIAMAVASLDCDVPPMAQGPPQIYLEVQFEFEQAFVDAHADEFAPAS